MYVRIKFVSMYVLYNEKFLHVQFSFSLLKNVQKS